MCVITYNTIDHTLDYLGIKVILVTLNFFVKILTKNKIYVIIFMPVGYR